MSIVTPPAPPFGSSRSSVVTCAAVDRARPRDERDRRRRPLGERRREPERPGRPRARRRGRSSGGPSPTLTAAPSAAELAAPLDVGQLRRRRERRPEGPPLRHRGRELTEVGGEPGPPAARIAVSIRARARPLDAVRVLPRAALEAVAGGAVLGAQELVPDDVAVWLRGAWIECAGAVGIRLEVGERELRQRPPAAAPRAVVRRSAASP